jgi:tRNA threonylcarbamoyladenosine biosynthesis protein TsaB
MKLDLALETSTQVGSVALASGADLLGEMVLGARTRHAEALLPALEHLLGACGATTRDLGRIAVGGGPGSFTGLRVAAATAKGLVHALQVPLHAVSGLLVTAANTGLRDRAVCALFDARRSEVYAGCYRIAADAHALVQPSVWHLDELLQHIDPRGLVFTGDGALKHEAAILKRGGSVLPAHVAWPRASTLLSLLHDFPDLGQVASPATWEPDYLRAASAERGISA